MPSYTPETWIDQGRIVLDPDNNPVRKWPEIPLVLSSKYQGYDMEVVRRLNLNITYRDFRARMPRVIIKGKTAKKAWALSTLSMRNTRFRLAACCLAWADREGSDILKAYLDKILPPECLAVNSTEGFRDLTLFEVEQAKGPNKGNFPQRAGGRALDEATRQKRNEVGQTRSKTLLAQHHEVVGAPPLPAFEIPEPRNLGRKRKRAESSLNPGDEGENTRAAKRQESAAKTDPILLCAESSTHTSVSVAGCAPTFGNASDSIPGLGQLSGSRQHSQIPESPVPTSDSEPDDENPISMPEGRGGRAEDPSLHTQPPAANNAPYYLTNAQLEAFAKSQRPDLRFLRPTDRREEAAIRAALRRTRDDCRAKLGPAGSTVELRSTRRDTYFGQLLQIRDAFRRLWPGRGEGDAPTLVYLEAWDGEF